MDTLVLLLGGSVASKLTKYKIRHKNGDTTVTILIDGKPIETFHFVTWFEMIKWNVIR